MSKYVIFAVTLLLKCLPLAVSARGVYAQEMVTDGASDYEVIITEDTITWEGVFTVHQVDDRWYLEMPEAVLGRDMLWYAELGSMPVGVNLFGALEIATKLVRFERFRDRIFVRDFTHPIEKRASVPGESYEQSSSHEKYVNPINLALEETSLPAVIISFPIAAESPDGSAVIDVTGFFASDLSDFSVKSFLAGGGYLVAATDSNRSYVQSIKAFPDNIHVNSFLTFATAESSVSIVVHHSITLLPEKPMMPRIMDTRVGYFIVGYDDYSGENTNGVVSREIITRYRLEKKNPDAVLSDPIEPIVYYISREVPEKWRPYMKQAVEIWQSTFEEAGFSNAIIARDAPSKEEDPDWDPSDTRHSVIRWMTQPLANAIGPQTHDPRSGETLSAHVLVWAETPALVESWYFTQASAVDENARKLPLSDELVGRLMTYVVAHEVGHTLGLRHNHRASQVFTIEQLRDPEFTDRYGTAPSIMSYGRMNYIAQPGDGITNLIPQIGPYDKFAISWGYRPIPDAESPEDEVKTLDHWAARQIDNPFLAFGGEDTPSLVDPNVLTENLGSDRIEATRLGIRNLERVMGYLVPATTETGRDYSKLNEMYHVILDQRSIWLTSVAKLLGGVEETRTLAGRGEAQFHRVSAEEQRAAVQFLMENLRTPDTFLTADVLDLISPINPAGPMVTQQKNLLNELLNGSKYIQLANSELFDPENSYSVAELLSDVQAGLFEELEAEIPRIDPLRRQLQRHYLSVIIGQLAAFNTETDPDQIANMAGLLDVDPEVVTFLMSNGQGSDIRAAARYNLARLRVALESAIPRTEKVTTLLHLQDLLAGLKALLADEATSDHRSLLMERS